MSLTCLLYCHVYVVIHFCDSMGVFLSLQEYVQVFYHRFIWVYCRWRSNYQEERVGIPLTGLTLPHLDGRIKPGPSYVMISFCIWHAYCDVSDNFMLQNCCYSLYTMMRMILGWFFAKYMYVIFVLIGNSRWLQCHNEIKLWNQ
jgi:hypothetical protein